MFLVRHLKTILVATVALLASLSLVSCSGPKGNDPLVSNSQVTIYYTKASDDLGVVLIPVLRKIDKKSTPYETALKELFLGPTLDERERLKLNSEIPEGVRLVKIKESPHEVEIDISNQFMKGGGSESMQVRFRQLRETALNLAKGRPVFLYVDGVKATTIGGEGLEVPQPLDSTH